MATNTSPSIYFPVANHDSRLEMVIALEYNGVYRVYQLLEEEHVINDDLAGMHIMITSYSPFMTRVFDRIEVFL
ncbi:MAG: hypothetical protein QXK74_02110 [Candidatus Nitrosocaldaceae archaeon]